MEIDYDRLREDLKNEALGAFYGGGFGGALIEAFDIDNASDDELISIAQQMHIDINKYVINEYYR